MIPTDLPWQLDVLIIETVVSMGLAYLMAMSLNGVQYGKPATWIIGPPWDLLCIALIVSGGNWSWQHVLLTVLYTTVLLRSLHANLTRRYASFADEKKRPGVTAFFTVLLGAGLIALIVTG